MLENGLAKHYLLSGTSDSVSIICHTFIALKAIPGTLDTDLLIIPINKNNDPTLGEKEAFKKIMESDIPSQIRDSNGRDHSEFVERTINAGLPYDICY